nr:hypothetical protein [Tanacetum cinerariifolium]
MGIISWREIWVEEMNSGTFKLRRDKDIWAFYIFSPTERNESYSKGGRKSLGRDDEKKRDMSRVKCYNYKKEGHFAKDCKKVKVKDYEYYKTKMLFAKKDKDEQVLLAEDQACMESSSDSDQEINENMVFMAQIKKVLSDSEASSSSADEKISENGDQPLPVIAQVSLAGTAQNAPPTLKDPKFWTTEEKKTRKIDHLARSLLIQGLPNDIYSLIVSNETAKDLWDALERQMRSSEYGEKDRKAAILYEYETFKAIEGEQLLDTYLRYLQVINDLNKCGYKKDNYMNDALGYKKKVVVLNSDPLALVAEKTNVSKRKKKVVVSSDSEGSGADDFSELKKITALLAKDFNRRKFYSKPINNNLRTSSTSQYANKKQEFVKSDDKKANEKKKDTSKGKCYNCKKEGHFAKDCKKAKVKDYNYYKTMMLLAKKDIDEQVLFTEDQAWMESRSDSDKEINANMVFMAQIEKVLLESEKVLHLLKKPLLRDLKNTVLEKDFKISELEECVRNKDLEIEKCLERLNDCENKLHKMGQTNQTVHMVMPSKDNLYNGRKGISFENLSYFEKVKDLRPTLYDEKVIGLGYTLMFLTHSDEALEIEKFKRSRENKIEFAYDYGNLNASYVNVKINFEDDYFQEIINPYFEKIDSPFQQISSLKPYVSNVILKKIIIDLEYEVVNLLEKK